MKKIIYLLMIIPIAFASCEVEKLDDSYGLESTDGKAKIKAATTLVWPDGGCTFSQTDLIAGQHMVVGNVSVAVDGADYVITYSVTEPGWCLTEVHVEVAEMPEDFPHTNSGNPKIGNFEYNKDIDCSTNHEVRIPVSEGTWIAAHGVVECSSNSPETILASLPETVDFCGNGFGPDAYISITVDGGVLSGNFGSYCVDNDAFINQNGCYEDADVYVSTESLPAGIENTGNINAVNWILNEDFGGVYTFGDIQYAIWLLLDPIEADQPGLYTLGTYSVENAEAIVAAANYDFIPGCGDFIGIILKKDDIQPVIIPFPLECNDDRDETVWAKGCDFPGSSWAMYFQYE